MRRCIFGCGYLGSRVARRWLNAGGPVFVVTRSVHRAEELEQEGFRAIVADVTQPQTLVGLPAAETVLYAVGYDRRSGVSRQQLYVDGLRNVLAALSPQTGRILYVSSTGVYGSAAGAWVDEDSPCRPTRDAGMAMEAAERMLRGSPFGGRSIMLRMAGIYGSGRIPRMTDLVQGRPIGIAEREHLNLIHVEDAAAVVLAAESCPNLPGLYTVSDGHPCRRREFYRQLAALLGLPEPAFVAPEADAAGSERTHDDKRVRNARMLRELDVRLRYANYQQGLAAIVAGDTPS
jgi:nucleoside-diphosphate-sugar epimerase